MTGPWSSLGGTGPIGEDMTEFAGILCAGKELVQTKEKSPSRGERFAARCPDAQEYQTIESSTILRHGNDIKFEVRGVGLTAIFLGTTSVPQCREIISAVPWP